MERDEARASLTRRLGAVALVAFAIGGLSLLRHNPDLIEDLYEAGNLLNTHATSGLTLAVFCDDVARLELVLLAGSVYFLAATQASRRRLVAIVATTVAFAVSYADSITFWTMRVAGHLYVLVCDDALISMRYARNFAEGRGLVYNAGEWVDGFSNPLWTLLMIVPHALGMHEGIATVPIVALGGALVLATGLLARTVLEKEGAALAIQILVAFAILYDTATLEFAITGMETPLLSVAAALVLYGGLCNREWPILVGLPVLVLARADGAIVAALLVGWLVLEEAMTSGDALMAVAKRRWRRGALVVGVAAALVAWRYSIYGYPAPNTYYLKVYPLAARVRTGLAGYGVRGLITYGLPVLFVLWAAHLNEAARRARRMLLPVAGVWLYAIWVGGDAFTYMRFIGPITPFLWTAVGLAAAASWSKRAALTNAVVFAGILLAVPVKAERGVLGAAWSRAGWVEQNVIATKTIERTVPPDGLIATFYAGMPYYAPHHRFIDLLGKTEPHIAHQDRIHGTIPGHNKFDFDFVYRERRPDVTFTANSCDDVAAFEALPPEGRGDRHLGANIYQAPLEQMRDETFRNLYAPHRVILEDQGVVVGHPIGCWFVREGAAIPLEWKVWRD